MLCKRLSERYFCWNLQKSKNGVSKRKKKKTTKSGIRFAFYREWNVPKSGIVNLVMFPLLENGAVVRCALQNSALVENSRVTESRYINCEMVIRELG